MAFTIRHGLKSLLEHSGVGVGVGLGVGLLFDTGIYKRFDKNLVDFPFGAHGRCKAKVCVFASISLTVC